jgi:hypothetical protein
MHKGYQELSNGMLGSRIGQPCPPSHIHSKSATDTETKCVDTFCTRFWPDCMFSNPHFRCTSVCFCCLSSFMTSSRLASSRLALASVATRLSGPPLRCRQARARLHECHRPSKGSIGRQPHCRHLLCSVLAVGSLRHAGQVRTAPGCSQFAVVGATGASQLCLAVHVGLGLPGLHGQPSYWTEATEVCAS